MNPLPKPLPEQYHTDQLQVRLLEVQARVLAAASSAGTSSPTLVAVSKTHPIEAIENLYALGHRQFGENKVQELLEKWENLPKDIEWHLIGHLQSNKVKYIAPFVTLIHSIDSEKLLIEVNKQGKKVGRVIDVLLQLHIASEETKFGWDYAELGQYLESNAWAQLEHVRIVGLMGMASFTSDLSIVRGEFDGLAKYHRALKEDVFKDNADFTILSMGMSGDYELALQSGSNMVRVGSGIFGSRSYGSV